MKKMLWIVNPHAGRGAMRGKLIDCILTFQEAGFDVTLHVTEGPEDATRVAQARAGEFDRIVCAGGDGTLNEVVTGLMQSKVRPPLGYIPAGTTNDFATSLGIPKVPAEAAAIAREAQMRSEASEAARIAYVTQARTLRERRGSYIKMVVISALVAAICSRLRGTVGALGFSISTGLVIWGVVDAVMLTNQIKVLDKRAMDMMRARDAAAKIAAEAQEL